jgi:hypothetical protein
VGRDNYSYQKYQKELAAKKKREEKMQARLNKKKEEVKVESEQGANQDVPA